MNVPDLLAAYWTLAGDVFPGGPVEISPFPFRDRVEAAGRAGWRGMGFIPQDIHATLRGMDVASMRSILADNGIVHVELECIADWFRTDDRRAPSDAYRHDILELARSLGARDVKIVPGLGRDPGNPTADELIPPIARMTEEFATLCLDAASHGTAIALEIMPFSNVRTIDDAVRIVGDAGQPNGGILLDVWHLSRGGIPFADIATIPPHMIKSIELDDAQADYDGTLWQDTIMGRVLPGEGKFDVTGFIDAVRSTGFTQAWGVEILSSRIRKWPLDMMATRTFDATAAAFGATELT